MSIFRLPVAGALMVAVTLSSGCATVKQNGASAADTKMTSSSFAKSSANTSASMASSQSKATGTATAALSEKGVVYFPFASSKPSADSMKALKQYAVYLTATRNLNVTIEGHTDERGSEAYNQKLGLQRAKATARVLMRHGVKKSRITTVSRGESQPAVVGANEETWAKNRRAEIKPAP